MKLSANEEYGVRCLVRIGYAEARGLTIPEISQAEGVSPAYAAKILRDLRKGGFVKAARGKEGGYTLARPAEEIVIGDVVGLSGPHVNRMIAEGLVVRVRGGVIAQASAIAAPDNEAVITSNIGRVRRFVRDLDRAGISA